MIPHFDAVSFVSYYVEIPIMIVMYLAWIVIKRIPMNKLAQKLHIDAESAAPSIPPSPIPGSPSPTTPLAPYRSPRRVRWFDLVDTKTVDLYRDEHEETVMDQLEDEEREARLSGKWRWWWRLFYIVV